MEEEGSGFEQVKGSTLLWYLMIFIKIPRILKILAAFLAVGYHVNLTKYSYFGPTKGKPGFSNTIEYIM